MTQELTTATDPRFLLAVIESQAARLQRVADALDAMSDDHDRVLIAAELAGRP